VLLNLVPLYLFSRCNSSGNGYSIVLLEIWYCIYNMSEIQTEHYEPTKKPDTDPFENINEWQARDAAKRIVEQSVITPAVETSDTNTTTRDRIFAGTAAAAVVATGVLGLNAMGSDVEPVPTFSEQTTPYSVQSGEGLYDAAESIPGINTIDIRDAVHQISVNPANIDVLSNGLQSGEQIQVPISVNGVESSDE